jgi:hypothetical protein
MKQERGALVAAQRRSASLGAMFFVWLSVKLHQKREKLVR